jgi:hypothetical protein
MSFHVYTDPIYNDPYSYSCLKIKNLKFCAGCYRALAHMEYICIWCNLLICAGCHLNGRCCGEDE